MHKPPVFKDLRFDATRVEVIRSGGVTYLPGLADARLSVVRCQLHASHLLRLRFWAKLGGMSYETGVGTVRAPLFGIGGLCGVAMMVILLAAFPEVRWFALLSIPLGILMAAGMRAWRYLEYRHSHRLMWQRNVRHFQWPQPIG